MAVPYYALLFGGALLLGAIVGPFERSGETAAESTPKRHPFSAAEIKTLAVLAATLALWLTDWLHRLSPAVPALIGGGTLLLPGVGALSWKTFEAKLS